MLDYRVAPNSRSIVTLATFGIRFARNDRKPNASVNEVNMIRNLGYNPIQI
jgi:hypothetical protein